MSREEGSELSHLFATKGDRTMSQGFIAQYAAEATRQTSGVADLDKSSTASLKEALGYEHEGYGVTVHFQEGDDGLVALTVYPVLFFGHNVPEVAWAIQENVKKDVETFTGLLVQTVDVHVMNIVAQPEEAAAEEELRPAATAQKEDA